MTENIYLPGQFTSLSSRNLFRSKLESKVPNAQNTLYTDCTDPHDVDDVLAADRPIVFVVSSAPRRDGGGAGAAPADC